MPTTRTRRHPIFARVYPRLSQAIEPQASPTGASCWPA
jgi:hypothetical protein